MTQTLYPAGPASQGETTIGGGFYGMIAGAAEVNGAGEAMPVVVAQPPAGYAGNPLDHYANGVRVNGPIIHPAVTPASAAHLLPALDASRVIYVRPNRDCFVQTGNSAITVAPGTGHPVAATERWYFPVPAGHTHIAVIGDNIATNGNITVCAMVPA